MQKLKVNKMNRVKHAINLDKEQQNVAFNKNLFLVLLQQFLI